MTPDTLKSWQSRLGLGDTGMAAYIGVPRNTYLKWTNGTRRPDTAPLRLMELLLRVEKYCPEMHADLLKRARESSGTVKATRVRTAVKKPAVVDSGGSEMPSWMTGGTE